MKQEIPSAADMQPSAALSALMKKLNVECMQWRRLGKNIEGAQAHPK
jgi:hypothetical protein